MKPIGVSKDESLPNDMTKHVSPATLRQWLTDGKELALLDVREEGVFFDGHLFFASCVPHSRLELLMDDLVPRRDTRIVLCDGGDDGLAPKAARRLGELGYTDLAILDGGVDGWKAAGNEVFSGVGVPSKAFGEFVEHEYDTPRVPPERLQEWIDEGRDMVILDSRPFDEFHRMNIPGGVDTPGAELVYRVQELAPDPETLVVVNCAGRTRSIIGAQSLINAGIPNEVVALKDGTMGWELAGFQCEEGQTRRAPEPSAAGLADAQARARRVAERFGVQRVNMKQVDAWRAGKDRTTYVMDVRHAEEFEAGHLPGSRHAPGGQLVQATDEYMPVRNARVVLADDTEVRAIMTASWLIQLGWPEVYVLEGGIGSDGLETGPHEPVVLGLPPAAPVNHKALMRGIAEGLSLAVLDLADSKTYRTQHLPGAWWGVRSRMAEAAAAMPRVETLVLTSEEGTLARLATEDARGHFRDTEILHLEGGTNAWMAAGLPTKNGLENPTTRDNDIWYKPYERETSSEEIEAKMREYLSWEVALVDQIKRDGTIHFKKFE